MGCFCLVILLHVGERLISWGEIIYIPSEPSRRFRPPFWANVLHLSVLNLWSLAPFVLFGIIIPSPISTSFLCLNLFLLALKLLLKCCCFSETFTVSWKRNLALSLLLLLLIQGWSLMNFHCTRFLHFHYNELIYSAHENCLAQWTQISIRLVTGPCLFRLREELITCGEYELKCYWVYVGLLGLP